MCKELKAVDGEHWWESAWDELFIYPTLTLDITAHLSSSLHTPLGKQVARKY